MRRVLLWGLVLVLAAGLGAGALVLRQHRLAELAAQPPPARPPWALTTAPVARGTATRGFPALAIVTGAEEVAVTPQISGLILEMGPREGVAVAAGALLARLDTSELDAGIAAQEAQLAGARAEAARKRREAERQVDLLGRGSASASVVDQWRAEAESAEEQVRSLDRQVAAQRVRRGYAEIRAPFAGVISARMAEPGDLAVVGRPLYRLTATDHGRVVVRLPASVLEQVRPGTVMALRHGERSAQLAIARVYPSLDERALGRAEADTEGLLFGLASGSLVSARVELARVDDALLVPRDALVAAVGEGASRVFVVTEDHLRSVPVQVLLRGREGVAVSGDLTSGQPVVVAHETVLLRLRDGDPVRPVAGYGP